MGVISSDAVRAKTGKGWDEWFAILDESGAAAWPHKEIALWLRQNKKLGDWWCQMVTVEFERARGLREINETAGGFSANISRTLAVPIEEVYPLWADARRRDRWLRAPIQVRKSTANKSLRITWNDGTNVEVLFYPKGAGKSQVTIEHSRLPNAAAVAEVKQTWAGAMDRLKAELHPAAARGPGA